jgi:hypothetical protein
MRIGLKQTGSFEMWLEWEDGTFLNMDNASSFTRNSNAINLIMQGEQLPFRKYFSDEATAQVEYARMKKMVQPYSGWIHATQ